MKQVTRQLLQKGVLSTEAASYTRNNNLFSELSEEFRRFREKHKPDDKDLQDALFGGNFTPLLRKYTGMHITFMIDEDEQPNAYVVPPGIDRNNPILHQLSQHPFNSRDIVSSTEKSGETFVWVDRENAKVSGPLAELAIPIYITKGMLYLEEKAGGYVFSPEEASAIILHEIGHVFSYYDALSLNWRRNIILYSHVEEFRDTNDAQYKLKIINKLKAQQLLPKDLDDKMVINGDKDKQAILIVTLAQRAIAEDPKSVFANATMFESAADQFATRLGAGEHLTSGLMKLYRLYKGNSALYRFNYYLMLYLEALFLFVSAKNVWIAILFPGMKTIIFALCGLMYIFNAIVSAYLMNMNPYDDPLDRILRIRREMIGSLKEGNAPARYKKSLVESLDHIDEMIKENDIALDKNHHFNHLLFTQIIPFFRTNRKTKEKQQLFEKLVNNDIYLASARFES